MQVGHGPSNVSSKGEAKGPVEGDVIILQYIVEAALGAVLSDDGHIGNFEGSANKLAQVGVIQLSAWKGEADKVKHLPEVLRSSSLG